MCLIVFVNCLVKQFAIYFGAGCYFVMNVMEVFNLGGGALLTRKCL